MSGDDFTVDAQDESKICAVQVTSSRWVGQSRGGVRSTQAGRGGQDREPAPTHGRGLQSQKAVLEDGPVLAPLRVVENESPEAEQAVPLPSK